MPQRQSGRSSRFSKEPSKTVLELAHKTTVTFQPPAGSQRFKGRMMFFLKPLSCSCARMPMAAVAGTLGEERCYKQISTRSSVDRAPVF